MDDLLGFLERHRRRIGFFTLWGAVVATATFVTFGAYMTAVALRTGTNGTAPGTFEYMLYKNTRFAECAATIPQSRVNCTLVMTDLGGLKIEEDHRWLNKMVYSGGPGLHDYHWCSLASCLTDFKVIPSTPRGSAFGSSGLFSWIELLITVGLALWSVRAMFFKVDKDHDKHTCKGFGFFDWAGGIATLSMFLFWWYSFINLAKDPQESSPMSILGWISIWQFALILNFHPFACKFTMDRGTGLTIVHITYLVAIIQWACACYVFHLKQADIGTVLKYPKYNCLESEINRAPGTSLCSAKELCSKDWMFWNVGWHSGNELHGMRFEISWAFYALSTVFLVIPLPFLVRGKPMNFKVEGLVGKLKLFLFWGPVAILFFIEVWISVVVLKSWFNPQYTENREGPIAYDVRCRALHVPFSPWKYFLDIDDGNRPLRVARMWLNA